MNIIKFITKITALLIDLQRFFNPWVTTRRGLQSLTQVVSGKGEKRQLFVGLSLQGKTTISVMNLCLLITIMKNK